MNKITKLDLKNTLNLPKTSFPMKANLTQNEPQSIKNWESNELYEKIVNSNIGKSEFIIHDGPPYANGSIHLGHLLNKVLKDFVFRSQNLLGNYCTFTPGWDCHGLPIEHKVMTEIVEKKSDKLKTLTNDQQRNIIRSECKKYAEKFIKIQSTEMKQLLTLADYKKPYLTMNKEYECKVLEVFADLVAEGIVYRQLKPVHWSIANQTALADAELEYQDKKDPSIYVKFESSNINSVNRKLNLNLNTAYFLIWTTTPWTLPANLAIAVHKDYDYLIVKDYQENHLIIAKNLKEIIEKSTDQKLEIITECKGNDLLSEEYQHPFCDRTGKIVHADYVTLEDGTGLVHTAPGHGTDDYLTGLREKLETYCPVKENGVYDETVPSWLVGKHIWKANPEIIKHLEDSHHLFFHKEFVHSYPHDWRSKHLLFLEVPNNGL